MHAKNVYLIFYNRIKLLFLKTFTAAMLYIKLYKLNKGPLYTVVWHSLFEQVNFQPGMVLIKILYKAIFKLYTLSPKHVLLFLKLYISLSILWH